MQFRMQVKLKLCINDQCNYVVLYYVQNVKHVDNIYQMFWSKTLLAKTEGRVVDAGYDWVQELWLGSVIQLWRDKIILENIIAIVSISLHITYSFADVFLIISTICSRIVMFVSWRKSTDVSNFSIFFRILSHLVLLHFLLIFCRLVLILE